MYRQEFLFLIGSFCSTRVIAQSCSTYESPDSILYAIRPNFNIVGSPDSIITTTNVESINACAQACDKYNDSGQTRVCNFFDYLIGDISSLGPVGTCYLISDDLRGSNPTVNMTAGERNQCCTSSDNPLCQGNNASVSPTTPTTPLTTTVLYTGSTIQSTVPSTTQQQPTTSSTAAASSHSGAPPRYNGHIYTVYIGALIFSLFLAAL